MSARQAIAVSRRTPCDGGVSPNAYVPQITVEVRVHFPPLIGRAEIRRAFDAAITEAYRRITEEVRNP